ncbi:MAG TPA: threonine--tRNA ligase [Solirubrobacteraceae bacterium]|jgi:threonyl-tRNA synthetase|nr:threonine--tRNA ligase [Solirubrobacteraceae bacterium]
MAISATLPDGKALVLPDGASGGDAAAAIGPGLARAALAVVVDGELRDLARPVPDGADVSILTASSGPEALALIRHDAAHVLAAAVRELYPGVKISIGPAIEQGFYYDFEFPAGVVVSEADFPAIEARMREHVRAGEVFVREDVPVAVARERFAGLGEDYKVELIDDLVAAADPANPLETVSLYTNGPFTDLCRGPHAPTTKTVKAFKLQSVAGAYWRGDSSRTMLTRIYGTAFFSKEDLAAHLERLEQARARDHRKLGRELGLFHFNELSPGSAFWLPRGTTLWNTLVGVSRELTAKAGYEEVKTPQLYDSELWKISGHWDKYRENMFVTESEDRQLAIKPMNCPGHFLLYKSQRHSYRDLPVRYSEPGLLHRNEASGTLHGLLRVRHFTQDDAHIMCTPDQVQAEVAGCLDLGFEIYGLFGLTPELELSTRPEQRIGDDALWDRAEAELTRALESRGLPYKINPGDGAFYGPKIDLHMTDAIGRSWQLGTVQLDYGNPERFDMTYTGADNAEHRPVVIHRALMGTFERFIGILTEHYAGDFPVWLTPVQAIVLPISDRLGDVAGDVLEALEIAGVRAELDDRTESVGRKIRDAELRKIPYMLVVGDREAADGTVSVRARHGGDLGSLPVAELAARVVGESRERSA